MSRTPDDAPFRSPPIAVLTVAQSQIRSRDFALPAARFGEH
jgi:hypothetical protein